MRASRHCGFSMIELVFALGLSALVGVGLLLWLARPLEALLQSHRQAAAVDQAEQVLNRLADEVLTALPNSARIACAGRCLEFIPVVEAADYRAQLPGDTLDFVLPDDRFDVLMPLPVAPTGLQLVVNNQSSAGSGPLSAYSADAISNRAAVAAGTTAARIRFPLKLFPAPSPTQRFYLVDTPVSYLCSPGVGGTLRRYAGYPIQPAQPSNTALGDLLADDMLDCQFSVPDPSLLTIRLSVGDSGADAVSLYTQLRLVNRP